MNVQATIILMGLVFSSCEMKQGTADQQLNGNQPNAEVKTNKTEANDSNFDKMKTFEDDHISMSIPEQWEVGYSEVATKKIYTLMTPSAVKHRNFTLQIILDVPNTYMANMDEQALIDTHVEFAPTPGYATVHHEILTNPSGKNVFYIVQKRNDDNPTPYSISFFAPVGESEAVYSLTSSYNAVDPATFEKVKDIVREVVKSIRIKSESGE